VVVDHSRPTSYPAAGARRFQSVPRLTSDVAAAVLSQGERHVKVQGSLRVFAGGVAFQYLDGDAARGAIVELDELSQHVPAEPVDLLHREHVAIAHEVARGLKAWPVVHAEFAADLLLEDPLADWVERIVLAGRLLLLRAHAHEPDQCHADTSG